ncbi:LysE family translocator [Bacillaceae bacterium SIJ1]|uniref:LysE family translocator n=1 Tax=Litoribacterium kuwaitense TaxID=1398745 RepID=UPI0013ECD004|nr:LysE family translocator [Litoribacterium kuwaitense]NGP46127.1 LysE family translocator [Litoribacterium kuwaitense]
MDVSLWMSFIGVAIVLTVSPGPDVLFVTAQSASYGRRAGIATALGLCTGLLGHTAAAVLGISAVVYQSSMAFQLVKYAGAIYLLYLAWQAFRERNERNAIGQVKKQSLPVLYRRGILMNLLNPKVSLFFLALLPQFVSTNGALSVPLQMLFLGALFIIQALVVFAIVSFVAGRLGQALQERPQMIKWFAYGKAAIFTALSIRLALSDR